MAYSTFQEMGYPGDNFDRLKFHIRGAGKTQPVYILAISIEDYPIESVREKMKGVKGIKAIHQVNGTIDLVVKGEEQAKRVATELYRRTMAPIGIVKYEGQDMCNLYLDLREALDISREEGRMFHFYDQNKDSLQAIVKEALSKNQQKKTS